jgi:hypothetical protein
MNIVHSPNGNSNRFRRAFRFVDPSAGDIDDAIDRAYWITLNPRGEPLDFENGSCGYIKTRDANFGASQVDT